ncbi:hypothetical protein FY528_17035 [Hymenobacter lutimineralis]|uniref:Transglutaminase domain-containing protein n=1 Tax=Hymenobacter lutimineralis TaxID=2606448 RepID=A0A5D6UT88_9BACT|nr:hypothetical protein FY528_17035 [Hymenobacter lutimineralis]
MLRFYNVEKKVTQEDQRYISFLLKDTPATRADAMSYEQQLVFLHAAQLSILSHSTTGIPIPYNQAREPKNLFLLNSGICYDRSRVLEKIFMNAGFTTRHVALYAQDPGASALEKIPLLEVASHATTEVLTKRGWLVVDSNNPWLALDGQRQPYSLASMNAVFEQNRQIRWQHPPAAGYEIFYSRPSTFIYGLYSRHGRFYPPYTPGIPDYNLRELLYNF